MNNSTYEIDIVKLSDAYHTLSSDSNDLVNDAKFQLIQIFKYSKEAFDKGQTITIQPYNDILYTPEDFLNWIKSRGRFDFQKKLLTYYNSYFNESLDTN